MGIAASTKGDDKVHQQVNSAHSAPASSPANYPTSHFNPHTSLEPSDITITNGCSALFNALGFVLADPGDGILLTMPSYVAFPADFGALAKYLPIPKAHIILPAHLTIPG